MVFPTALEHCYLMDDNKDGKFAFPDERRISTKFCNSEPGTVDGFPLCTPEQIAQMTPEARERADHPQADDVHFVDEMLEFLGAKYAVDHRRVYATGFSNGAGMTLRLLVERSETFAAIAANAGGVRVEPKPGARPAPTFVTIGNKDPKAFGEVTVPMEEALVSVPEFAAKYIDPLLSTMQLENAYTFTDQDIDGVHVITWRYDTSSVGASNKLLFNLVENQGHSYPDMMPSTLWAFFSEYALPE